MKPSRMLLSVHSRPRLRGDRLQGESRIVSLESVLWVPAFAGTNGKHKGLAINSVHSRASGNPGVTRLDSLAGSPLARGRTEALTAGMNGACQSRRHAAVT